jgi:hypothetical protein
MCLRSHVGSGLEVAKGRLTFEDAFASFFAILLCCYGAGEAQTKLPDVAKAILCSRASSQVCTANNWRDGYNDYKDENSEGKM